MNRTVAAKAAKPLVGKVRNANARSRQNRKAATVMTLQEITSGETFSLVESIRAGLPFSALEEFQRAMDNPVNEVGALLHIPPRTWVRRKEQGVLKSDESDRLVRFSRLFGAATELFEGDVEAARRWLQTPKRALGNITPLEMAQTEVGAREVEHLMGRLEHGVFS